MTPRREQSGGRAAHLLALLYPRAWRREYGAEFTDLLQQTPLSARVIVDVAGHALLARLGVIGRAGRTCRRILGYAFADDLNAVYGDDPNGRRDPNNVGGSMAANISGGMR